MKKIILCFCLLAILGPAHAQDTGYPRTVIDGTGAAVTIPARPQIVATTARDPILARLLPAERLRFITPSTAGWADVGLLVIPAGDAAAYPALIESAETAGIPVYRTAVIASLDGWRAAVTQIGLATACEDRAAHWIARLDHRLAVLQANVSRNPPTRVLVLTPEGYTFGQDTLITDLIEAAGGINTAAAAGYGDFRQIDDRAIRALAPDVILLSPAWPGADRFMSNPTYAEIPAVRSGRVIRLPFAPTYPPDPAAAVLVLAILLHPAAMLFP
jgi:ABC-type Fe3+-hydroxamate transport system substrate-binding protein